MSFSVLMPCLLLRVAADKSRSLHFGLTQISGAGSTAAGQLSAASHAWVADRRKTFQGLMGSSAGIIRRQADMKQAVTAAAALSAEIEVCLTLACLPEVCCGSTWLRSICSHNISFSSLCCVVCVLSPLQLACTS